MRSKRICIIGGGLAGLTTAHELLKQSNQFEIQLFEATDRLGGRIHTLRNFNNGLYAEAGALTACSSDIDFLNLANELGVELIQRPDRANRQYFEDKQWTINSDATLILKYLREQIALLKQNNIINTEDDWISNDIIKKSTLDKLDNITLIAYLQEAVNTKQLSLNNPELLTLRTAETLLGLYANDINTLSAWDALRFLNQYMNSVMGYSVKGGNDLLIDALHQSLKDKMVIHLNLPVHIVQRQQDDTFIIVIDNDKYIPFDYVVVATPLSMLQANNDRTLMFNPPLPEMHTQSINHVTYNRHVARQYYNGAWLPNAFHPTITMTDRDSLWLEDHTAMLTENQHTVLEVHAGGLLGKSMQENNPHDIGAAELARVYKDTFTYSDKPLAFFWKQKPYQQGAYPSLGIKQKDCLQEISKNVDGIFFAGEYTSIGYPASMNGAVRSAHRVAEELKVAAQHTKQFELS